jgi:hypothetical protein
MPTTFKGFPPLFGTKLLEFRNHTFRITNAQTLRTSRKF